MADNQLFPTAIPNTYKSKNAEFKKANIRPITTTKISHRITNKGLLHSLHKNTQLKIPPIIIPKKTTTPRPPTKSQPRFAPYTPKFSHRARPKPKLSEDAQQIIDDPDDITSDTVVLRYVRPQIMKLINFYSDSGDYVNALKITQILSKVDEKLRIEEARGANLDYVRILLTKHQELQSIVSHFLDDWNDKFDQFLKATENEVESIREELQLKLEEYDSNQPQEIDMKLFKRSPRLLSLRDKEARFALAKDYKKAIQTQKLAEKCEQQEAQEAFERTYAQYMDNRQKLITQYKKKIDNYLSHAESVRQAMIANRDRTIQGYLKRMNALDVQIDNECEANHCKDEDALDHPISDDRVEFVVEEATKSPIPHFRAGMAFLRIREKPKTENVT